MHIPPDIEKQRLTAFARIPGKHPGNGHQDNLRFLIIGLSVNNFSSLINLHTLYGYL